MFTFFSAWCYYHIILNLDKEILQSIRSGQNSQVLNYLYKTTLRKVRHYIFRHGGNIEEANDIFQDAVVVLFNKVRQNVFDEKFSIDAFVFTVAKNFWINKVRNETRHRLRHDEIISFLSQDFENNILADLIRKERSSAVAKLFENLNDKCKELLYYYNHEGLSMKEISIKLGYRSEQVTKASHYRCKQFLINLVKGNKELENLLKN